MKHFYNYSNAIKDFTEAINEGFINENILIEKS